MGMSRKHGGTSEKITGRREWAEKDGNVSIAVTEESQKCIIL